MELDNVSPELFIQTILSLSHKELGRSRTNVYRWKAMKLIFEVSQDLDYKKLSFGCYKYGIYSDRTDMFLKGIIKKKSLHGANIGDVLTDNYIVSIISPVLRKLLPHYCDDNYSEFNSHAHVDLVPEKYRTLYECHDNLNHILNRIEKKYTLKKDIPDYYSKTSDNFLIFFDQLDYLKEDYYIAFYDFSRLMEEVLLVSNIREFNAVNMKKVLKKLKEVYKKDVSSLIFPFEITLSGDDKKYELDTYVKKSEKAYKSTIREIKSIKRQINKWDLALSIEELDEIIDNEIEKMDDYGRKELFNSLKSS